MRCIKPLIAACAATAMAGVLSFAMPAPASAADAMMAGCTNASSEMMKAMHGAMPAMTGSADHDFMQMAMHNDHAMMAAARIEARCGKDPKVKAAAKKILLDAGDEMKAAEKLTSGG